MSFFDDAYAGTPPWDIGRPQKAFVDLVDRGVLKEDPVLDIGCGTGEHVLLLVARGFDAVGIDLSRTAIEKAKRKAAKRRLKATFRVGNALKLVDLKRTFPTVIDSGMFHTLGDDERVVFADQLRRVLRPRGTYFLMCFSEKEPNWGGPRRVSKGEVRAAFPTPTFRIRSIKEAKFESRVGEGSHHAYIATIRRI